MHKITLRLSNSNYKNLKLIKQKKSHSKNKLPINKSVNIIIQNFLKNKARMSQKQFYNIMVKLGKISNQISKLRISRINEFNNLNQIAFDLNKITYNPKDDKRKNTIKNMNKKAKNDDKNYQKLDAIKKEVDKIWRILR